MRLQLARDSRCVARLFAEAIALWTGHARLGQSGSAAIELVLALERRQSIMIDSKVNF
jgi:hypothetical protein